MQAMQPQPVKRGNECSHSLRRKLINTTPASGENELMQLQPQEIRNDASIAPRGKE
jgi:hypothetical protein